VGTPNAGARLRLWFLRNLLEAAERELGAPIVANVPARVPARLRAHLSLDQLRATAALDTIPLDDGEEALLAFEQALGDGSGATLERVACEMLARQLVQAAAAVRVGDLFGTVARLRAPLEHPFVDVPIQFELMRIPSGLRLTIGIAGRPRATRLLGHIATGAIHAAERFARETHVEPLRLELETFADRARIDAHFRRPSTAPPAPDPIPASRRSSGATRLVPSLSDEVARILDSSRSNERIRPSDEPARRLGSDTPAPRSDPNPRSDPAPKSDPDSRTQSSPADAAATTPSSRPSRPPPGR